MGILIAKVSCQPWGIWYVLFTVREANKLKEVIQKPVLLNEIPTHIIILS